MKSLVYIVFAFVELACIVGASAQFGIKGGVYVVGALVAHCTLMALEKKK